MKKIEKQNIVEQIFNILKDKIIQGEIKTGEKLPSENELSAILGVSRSSVRSAIQKLVDLGIVEKKVGIGSFVKDINVNDYIEQMSEFIFTEKNINDIAEYRLEIEMINIKFAIKNITKENLDNMKLFLEKMHLAKLNNDIDVRSYYDYLFHLEIAKATKNEVFVVSYEFIEKILKQFTKELNIIYVNNFISKNIEDDVHYKLLKEIENKNIDACRDCCVEMFSIYKNA
ncbi:MAG: GntR family transcriptional regulator [Clostridioides sp.]|jgi:GntR family transcriptional repressor for pyruvate dehydrogenase complex|nr:GntR family transcriptional regulator [Clostridioides sp.]